MNQRAPAAHRRPRAPRGRGAAPLQDQRIADEEPEEAPAWSGTAPAPPDRAHRSDRPVVVDEWVRRQVRRLLDQVGAMPSPAFLRREPATASFPARTPALALPNDRTVRIVAACVFGLLALCLALTLYQWRATHAAEASAKDQLRRTAATRDFLSDLLRTAAGAASADPAQRPRMKEVLDAATPRIVQTFSDDPAAQLDLLSLVASMYGDIGEHESRRALLALQRVALRRVHGEAHPAVIGSLLDEAQSEIERDQLDAAGARLLEADALITKAHLDDDALRGRWWMLRSDAQPGTVAGAQALDRAIASFEGREPVDPRLGEALSRKAWRVLPTHPAQAAALFERIAGLATNGAATQRRQVLIGLAQARQAHGEYEAALTALDAARALGSSDAIDEARFARALHREGQRERALAAFDALVPQLSTAPQGVSAEAIARAYFAECLAAEGRPMQAIALLEAVGAQAGEDLLDTEDHQRVLLALGDAYDRAGLWWKARDTLKAGLDQRLAQTPPDDAQVAQARERWGRFLLGRGDIDDARAQFDLVLDEAGDRSIERVVLAFGGLARVALARHDWDAALTASTHAVVGFENLVGPRDVRSGPYLWLIHAEALRNVDDHVSARIWATRALDASRRYDAPDAQSIRDAEATLSRLSG